MLLKKQTQSHSNSGFNIKYCGNESSKRSGQYYEDNEIKLYIKYITNSVKKHMQV